MRFALTSEAGLNDGFAFPFVQPGHRAGARRRRACVSGWVAVRRALADRRRASRSAGWCGPRSGWLIFALCAPRPAPGLSDGSSPSASTLRRLRPHRAVARLRVPGRVRRRGDVPDGERGTNTTRCCTTSPSSSSASLMHGVPVPVGGALARRPSGGSAGRASLALGSSSSSGRSSGWISLLGPGIHRASGPHRLLRHPRPGLGLLPGLRRAPRSASRAAGQVWARGAAGDRASRSWCTAPRRPQRWAGWSAVGRRAAGSRRRGGAAGPGRRRQARAGVGRSPGRGRAGDGSAVEVVPGSNRR